MNKKDIFTQVLLDSLPYLNILKKYFPHVFSREDPSLGDWLVHPTNQKTILTQDGKTFLGTNTSIIYFSRERSF
jgi:hypothetical protein